MVAKKEANSLQELNLAENNITTEGAKKIAEAFKRPKHCKNLIFIGTKYLMMEL